MRVNAEKRLCGVASSRETRETPKRERERNSGAQAHTRHIISSVLPMRFKNIHNFVMSVSNIKYEYGEIDLLDPSSLTCLRIVSRMC